MRRVCAKCGGYDEKNECLGSGEHDWMWDAYPVSRGNRGKDVERQNRGKV